MPPRPKYTKEQIVETALRVVSKKGLEALTAKELGDALGTSTSPIFTVFASMQEVQSEVRDAAMRRFEAHARKPRADMPTFKQVGMQMIAFAREEPELYRLLFMSENSGASSFEELYGTLGDVADECFRAIRAEHGLSEEGAKKLFEHVWVYTFGIGALCATGACRLSEDEISEMLTQEFDAIMLLPGLGKQ